MREQLAPHIDELERALDMDRETLRDDLYALVVEFKVPVGEAKRSILRKYGSRRKTRELEDIQPGDQNLEFTARVVEVTSREITTSGERRVIFSGTLLDESGEAPFTAWQDYELEAGDAIHVTGAYVRDWHGRPEVNLGEHARVESTDADLPKAWERVRKLRDLRNGDRGISVEVMVLEAEERQINTRNGQRRIVSGVVGDETARLPFTLWDVDKEVGEGDRVRVDRAYVKTWRGVPTVNIGEHSSITPLGREVAVAQRERLSMAELDRRPGAYDVDVEGSVLSVRPGSGLISRCPECGRVIQKNTCRAHGQVDGEVDMRIKAILDDGTGSLTLILDRELTERVAGFTIEEAQNLASDSMSTDVVEERLRRWLTGRPLAARGNVSKGEYGIMMVAEDVWWPEDDTAEQAQRFLGRYGGG